jgi:hypothetical protein
VYKFARKMQIQSLTEILDQKFKDEANAYQVFEIFDLYMEPRNQAGLDWAKRVIYLKQVAVKQYALQSPFKVIEKNARAAFYSIPWICLSLEGMLESLRWDCLNITEMDLVIAVMHWAQFQLQVEGGDPEDGALLRVKMLPALQLIRFANFDHKTFANRVLKLAKLEKALSDEEQLAIFMSINLADFSLMPLNFHSLADIRKKTW